MRPSGRDSGGMYEVWFSRGGELTQGPRFAHARDARRFVDEYIGPGSVAIRSPDGNFVALGSHDLIPSRRRSRRVSMIASVRLRLRTTKKEEIVLRSIVRDVSAVGMRVELGRPIELQPRSRVWLLLPGNGDVPARVAWSRGIQVGLSVGSSTHYSTWLGSRLPDIEPEFFAAGSGVHPTRNDDE